MGVVSDVFGTKAVEEIYKIFQKIIESGNWEKMFIKNGRFLQEQYVGHEIPFQKELYKVFSSDSMLFLAEKLDRTDGFSFVKCLDQTLSQLMSDYGIPEIEANAYIQYFMELVLNEICREYPDLYNKCHFGQAFQKIGLSLKEQSRSLTRIESKLEDMIKAYTPEEIDGMLKEKTTDPSIGLDFFVIDDNQFKRSFQRALYQNKIYIRGKGREEVSCCILNELRILEESRPILVVKTHDSWERLRKGIRGHILIPMFYDDNIIAPEGNTTIFVYGETEACTGHNVLELRPKKLSTIREALRCAGMDDKRIDKLITATHGLYIPMKKYLFNGRITNQSDWLTGLDDRIRNTALLIGKWNERSEGDRESIERLSGVQYDRFMSALAPYMKGEDPFIIRINSYHGDYFCLASAEDAWELIDEGEDRGLFQSFLEETRKIMSTYESWFSCSRQDMIEAQLKNERPHWSEEIRQGILQSLNMWVNYKDRSEYSHIIEKCINEVLKGIQTVEQWKYISGFFSEICEISPNTVLTVLRKEMDSPAGLYDLFHGPTVDSLFEHDYRNGIIWGLETLLVQERYVYSTLPLLAWLDDSLEDGECERLRGG